MTETSTAPPAGYIFFRLAIPWPVVEPGDPTAQTNAETNSDPSDTSRLAFMARILSPPPGDSSRTAASPISSPSGQSLSRSNPLTHATDQADSAASSSTDPIRPSPWIIGAGWDLLLFIATPLVILPLLWVSRQVYSADSIYGFVAAFGATGHHLPGLLRAYGDRALFRRFRVRFTVVPLLLLATTLPLLFTELRQGMMVILVAWGFWHGLMQVYGFARIYDAKQGQRNPRTVQLDWLLCLGWFAAGLVNSDGRVYQVLEVFHQSGGLLIDPAWINGFRLLSNIATALITVLYFAHLFQHKTANPLNPLKLLTLAISFAYWWYAMVEIDNILFGIALFEIFHDVQYLAIVWVFNRKRVDGNQDVGSFSRFLFRRSTTMLGLYIGLVFGYGLVSNFQQSISILPIQNMLIAAVWTSTLLHFYFDGFIWKVRESGTQSALGIQPGTKPQETRPLTDGQIHAAKWTPFFLAVAVLATSQWFVAGLDATQSDRTKRKLNRYQHLVRVLPGYDHAHLALGTRHYAAGDLQHAGKSFDRALALSNGYNAKAHYNRGLVDAALQALPDAVTHYKRSLELEPISDQAHHVHFALGAAHQSLGQPDLAQTHYQKALDIQPRFAVAQLGLGSVYRDQGRVEKARHHLKRAVELLEDAGDTGAHLDAARQQLNTLNR